MIERPIFIDADPDAADDAVGEGRPGLWFRVVALLILGIAVYTFVTLIEGPKVAWRHDYVSGKDAQPASSDTAP